MILSEYHQLKNLVQKNLVSVNFDFRDHCPGNFKTKEKTVFTEEKGANN